MQGDTSRLRSSRLKCLVFAFGLLMSQAGVAVRLCGDDATHVDLYGDPLPAGAAVRLGTTRFRFGSSQKGLAFAADNRTLIVAGERQSIVLLDASTGKRVREVATGEQSVRKFRLSADRRTLLTFGEEMNQDKTIASETIARWDLESGKRLANDKQPVAGPASLITRDERTAITGTGNGLLLCTDLALRKEIHKQKLDQGSVMALALSPDEQLIVAATTRGLYFWEWRGGMEPLKMEGERTRIESLAFSPDGSMIAEGPALNDWTIVLRDVHSHKILGRLAAGDGNPLTVSALAFTSDGRSLIAAGSTSVQGGEEGQRKWMHGAFGWDVSTRTLQHHFATGPLQPFDLALSHDDRWLAVGGNESVVKVWDLKSGKAMENEFTGHQDQIVTIQFAGDAETVVTASADGTVRVWDAGAGRQQRVLRHEQRIIAAALSPDGRMIASSSLDDTVRLWDAKTGKELHRLAGHGKTGGKRAVVFSKDGKRIVSWGDDLFRRTWDVETGNAVGEGRPLPGKDFDGLLGPGRGPFSPITQATFSTDARFLAVGIGNFIGIFDVESGVELEKYGHDDGLLISLALSPDGSRMATSAWGRPVETPNPDGTIFSLASKGHMARVREIGSGATLVEISLPDESAGPVAFSADGMAVAVAVGGAEPRIHVLDAAKGSGLAEIKGMPSYPRAVCLSKDGKRIACGFRDGTALVWDLKVAKPTP